MDKSVSFVLGAGFSVPIGYPNAKSLNDKILNCKNEPLAVHSSGQLYMVKDKSNGVTLPGDIEFDFCKKLIDFFNETKGYFDYEEFYDFVKDEAITNEGVKQMAAPLISNIYPFKQLVYSFDKIYPQLISYYLKDQDGKVDYEGAPHMCGPIFPGYTGILNCLQSLSENFLLNIHTLNHDVFFERLNISDWLQGQLCDGFEELGSPYYGDLDANGQIYRVRLAQYTGEYDKKIRLYKLHGSRNYVAYYGSYGIVATKEVYLKVKYGIDIQELSKEKRNDNGKFEYERCWFNYHSDFLTGTTSKIRRYKEDLLYKRLFISFEKNLKEAEKLIIVGYGGKDAEINKKLVDSFDYRNKPSFIIDPYPSEELNNLGKQLNSTIIQKHLEQVEDSDIGI